MPHKTYKRSRKDYPQGVIGIYDNAGQRNESGDHYMVVYEPVSGVFPILTMSAEPYSPQGIAIHGEALFRPTGGWQSGTTSAGKTINFADLPVDCQRVVLEDLKETEASSISPLSLMIDGDPHIFLN